MRTDKSRQAADEFLNASLKILFHIDLSLFFSLGLFDYFLRV